MGVRALVGRELRAAVWLQRAWIGALLSGDFVQGKGGLFSEGISKGFSDAHCCLGVACATLPEVAGLTSYRLENGYGGKVRKILGNWQHLTELTPEGMVLLGITAADHQELILLNDGGEDLEDDSVPFDLIAWCLEHLPYEVDA